MSNTSIERIDWILSGAITPGQSEPGSDGNKGVHGIPQSSSITGVSSLGCLMSYLGHSLAMGGGSCLSAEMQSVYSTAPFQCYVLTFWPGQKCHSRWCTGRKWYILMAVMRGNRVGGNWLMKWDEVKKNPDYTLIDWRTGREWPLNCMTVISAWWRLNIRFQRSSGRRTII